MHLRKSHSFSPVRMSLLFIMFAAVVFVFAFQAPAQFATKDTRRQNFDIRTDKDAASGAFMDRYPESSSYKTNVVSAKARETGLAQLQADLKVEVTNGPELKTPEIVSAKSGFLTSPNFNRVGTMRTFLSTYASAFGLSQGQVGDLVQVSNYANPADNMAWVEFEQRINGLPVFRGRIRGGFTKKGELAQTTGQLAPSLDATLLAVSPILTAAQAVSRAATSVGWDVFPSFIVPKTSNGSRITFSAWGPLAGDSKAWLIYFPLKPGVARLAWATEIWGNPEAYLILVDAEDGTVLFRKNLTNYQSQTATYSIYKNDSPAPLSPTNALPSAGTQAPSISRTTETLIGNESPNTFNNLGWMTDGTNKTEGNNVVAGPDRDGTQGVDAPVTGNPNRVFSFEYNPQTEQPLTSNYQNGEATDVFYWTNIYHDRLYLLGFTEAAFNFQNDNFERGGVAGDRIIAEIQDSSGTNNANFSTPPDGEPGRMQMYIFTGPTPDRTSGLDHDVLLHELTHGLSNRLHANATGLASTMSESMGEGWSDFYARALLSTADEDPDGIYTTGAWITYQLSSGYIDNYYYGIRRFPYAVMSNLGANGKPHNPLTFADIDAAQIDTTNGAYPRNPIIGNWAFEVHNAGEVWAMALFEVRARFIKRLGFAVGNQRILQYVTDAMKLDPVDPTFLQGRDAIIAAANAGGGTAADIADIWAGFAVRGMGYSAQVLNASTGSVVEAFDAPGIMAAGKSIVSESIPNGRLDPGELAGVSLCLSNLGSTTSGSVTGNLLATGGVTSPSGPQVYGAIPAGNTVCHSFTFTVGSSCGATLSLTLQEVESGGDTRNLSYSFPVGSDVAFAVELFDSVTAPTLPAGWTTSTLTGTANLWVTTAASADTPPFSAFAGEPDSISDNVLLSPTLGIPAGDARLTFRHSHNTEASYDGGVLEISINGGSFQDILAAGGSFPAGGYSGRLIGSNPLSNREAWTGTSNGYITTIVNLPAAAAGQNIRLRWRMTSDNSVSATGWWIDTVLLTHSQCGPAAVPTIVAVVPNVATPGVSRNATIMGSDLNGASAVTFNGTGVSATIGTGGTAISLPVIVSVAPGASLGLHTVTVTTPVGTSPAFSGFTVASLPSITAISPNTGAQGTTLGATITGTDLLGASGVKFSGSGVAATIGSGGTATSLPLTVTIDPQAALGPRTVTVTTPVGTSTAFSGFTVTPNPITITAISPSTGAQGGGTIAGVITGTGLSGATSITFSGTGITATIGPGGTSTTLPVAISITPQAALGLQTVTVAAAAGISAPFSGFTVGNPITITAVAPTSLTPGSTGGGTVTGTNLTGATAVTVSGTGVTAAIGSGGTATTLPVTITVSSGAALGLRTVTVITPTGASSAFIGFTVKGLPLIISTLPASGIEGTSVSLLAKNWTTASAVYFNGTPAASFVVAPTSTQLITNPGFESGNLTGWTTTNRGSGALYAASGTASPVSDFPTAGPHSGTYYALTDQTDPAANALIQKFTVPAAASRVTLSFSLFVNDQDSGPYVDSSGLNQTTLNPNQHARVDILTSQATPMDTGSGILRTFYVGVDPHANPNPYRDYSFDITDLIGSGGTFQLRFAQVDNQYYQQMGVDDVNILVESTSIHAVVPVGASTGPITVTTPEGTATSSGNFTITGTGTSSTAVTSSANPSSLGTSVKFSATVTGVSPAGTPAGTVSFMDGTTAIGSGTLNGSAQATFTTNQLTAGSHSITARYLGNSVYQYSTSPVLTQTVIDTAPYVYYITPNTGYQGTTMSATIVGANLLGASSVSFNGSGISATIGSNGTDTSLPITITIAADAPVSTLNITVTTPGGSSTGTNIFTVIQPDTPTIMALNPGAGAPGTTVGVSVYGLNMLGASAASFSGMGITATVTSSSMNSAHLNVTIAADAPLGMRSFTITNAYGTSVSFAGFTVANATSMPVSWKLRSYFNDTRTGSSVQNPSADLIGTKIYSSHGYRNGYSSQLSIYDTLTNTWTHGGATAPDASVERYTAAGGAALGRHYAIGGYGESGDSAAVEAFDPSTGKWSAKASMPTPRRELGGASLNDRIYALGGYSSSYGTTLDTNEVYDPATNGWTTLEPMILPVYGPATIGYNGKVYVFGGYTGQHTTTSLVQIYDVATNTWTTGAPLPTARSFQGAGMLNGQIAVFGGLVPSGFDLDGQTISLTAVYVTELYDPASDSWTIGPDLQTYFYAGGQGVTSNGTQVFVVPGYNYAQLLDASTNTQPTITSIAATSGRQGSTIPAVINGTDLAGATSIVFTGTGVTATVRPGGTSTSLPVTITIAPDAALGSRQFSVNTETGTSYLFTGFTVLTANSRRGQITSD
jgi:hypothetical protein